MPTETIQDFNERKEEFLKKYKELIEEFKVDILAVPNFYHDGNGVFRITTLQNIVDTKSLPKPSDPKDFL